MVRIGKPKTMLVELGGSVDAVYAHKEVLDDEVKSEDEIEATMEDENVEVKCFRGRTYMYVYMT